MADKGKDKLPVEESSSSTRRHRRETAAADTQFIASARTAARTARAPRPSMTAEEQEENDLFTAQLMSMMGTFEQLAKNPRMQKLLKTKDYRMGSQAETSQQATSRQRQVTEPVERVPTVVTGPKPLSDRIFVSALHLVRIVHRSRFLLAPSDFGNFLRQVILSKQWDKVGLVFDWMKVNKKLRPQSLSVYITLMGKAGFHFKALRSYNGLTDLDLKLNKYVCNALLKSFIDAGSLEKAFNLFEELKSEGFQPDLFTYSTVIAGCAKRTGAYEKAMSFVEELSSRGLKPDGFIYSSLLNVCARSGLENEAKALFEEMQTNGVQPASYHYAALLNMYAEKKKPEEAERVFEEFQKAGLPLNEVILNSLMKAHLSCGKIEEATRVLADMPSLNCPPGEVTYSLMMDAYCKLGLLERAQSLFEEIKKQNSDPGNYVYSTLISTYAKMGNVEMVTSLNKELERREQGFSDPILFNSVLKSFCELGLMDAVMNTLKRMNKESVSPDRATFNILICFFCKQGMLDVALHTLNDLKARKFRPNMNSYAPLITELSDTGKVDEAVKLLAESREYGVHPSANVWCSVIDALCRANRLDEAFMHFKTMADSGICPLPSCMRNVLILLGADLDMLDKLLGYGSMASKVLKEVNLATILSAYKKEGSYASMHKLVDFVKTENLNVGEHEGWDELISSLKQDGQVEILAKLAAENTETQLNAVSSAL
ncbi:hypothetical protein L7F22_024565 [Adiantum nelumboides]|nr:hypothetical protein [Adiantum nelumboides]